MRTCSLLLLAALSFVSTDAQTDKPNTKITLPATAAIRPSELKADLLALTHDRFRGREAGTIDELKASAWLAVKAKEAGLAPAGDDGSYFQFFSLIRHSISPQTSLSVGDRSFELWRTVLIPQTAPAKINAPVLFVGDREPTAIDTTNVKGKAVVILASPRGIDLNISLPERRYPTLLLRKYASTLLNNGAAAIIFIADSAGEASWDAVLPAATRGLYDIAGGPNATVTAKPPVLWFHASELEFFKQPGLVLKAAISVERFEYPSVNVVGKIPGTDAVLKHEHVLFSAHQDHDGIRMPYGGDSIYNGADDNASASVAMLAIARTFNAKPAKRSALFVWHGAEERGLLGSKYYSSHPTVPQKSIVAVLNADMIGRNHPDTAALMGATSPHMNSKELVAMAIAANKEGPKFVIDSSWDSPAHPEFWYFRSDHLPYARAGIPALFFSSNLHTDYHTPMDEARRINLTKLTRMTQWLYRTGWKVASHPKRPALLSGFKLER